MAREFLDYEFLWRLNGAGQIAGAHFKQLERITDDATGEVIMQREGPAIPVGDEAGAISLDVVLGKLNAALARGEELERAARIVAESERDAERAAKEAAQAERDQRAAERDALQAEVEALRNPPADPDFIPRATFIGRWPDDALRRFYAAKRQSPELEAMDELVKGLGGVRITSQRAIDGRAALVASGILSEAEAEAIFAPSAQ